MHIYIYKYAHPLPQDLPFAHFILANAEQILHLDIILHAFSMIMFSCLKNQHGFYALCIYKKCKNKTKEKVDNIEK